MHFLLTRPGGLLAGSLAIITDAAHLLTDFASFMISLFSLFVATRPASKQMNFGWHRAEVIGALISVLLIWVVTGILVFMAVQRIIYKTYQIDAVIMLITAGLGVLVNIVMGAVLHTGGGHGHSHGGMSHGHSHSNNQNEASTIKSEPNSKKGAHSHSKKNINIRAAFIHVLGDLVQSLGVFTAALIIYFRPDLAIVDPICTFLFSVLVLITTIAVMRDALHVLMEGMPRGIDFNQVLASLSEIEGVRKTHDLRIWALTMDKVAVSVHLAVGVDANAQVVLQKATKILRKDFGIFESTVQIERYSPKMSACVKCEHPEK